MLEAQERDGVVQLQKLVALRNRSCATVFDWAALYLAAITIVSPVILTPLSAQEPTTVTAKKPISPVAPAVAFQRRETGATLVSAEKSLDRILRGGEPWTTADLLAMQQQQTKVSEKIQSVTVSVRRGQAQGSGVVITADGYVLTAAHVAGKPNDTSTIYFSDGRRVKGKTLGMNRFMDAALIKIEDQSPNGWPHASLGTSAAIKNGQWCIAVGHPGGRQVDRPAVIRIGRILAKVPSTIVTDCELIGGDSGGPLFDYEGKLIGIHSRIGTDVDDNMHVPIDIFNQDWEQMAAGKAWGTLPGNKPVIGVEGIREDTRAIIGRTAKDGPADRAGIQTGDIIVKFDEVSIKTFDELKNAVDGTLPNDRVWVEVDRAGVVSRLRLTIGVLGMENK